MHLEAVRAICDKAETEQREFTDAERAEIKRHMDEASRVKAQIEAPDTEKADKKAADEALRQQLNTLGMGLEQNRRQGAWSEAFEQRLGYAPFGMKALISPSGSVAVPAFTTTIPGLQAGELVQELLQLLPRATLDGTDGYSYLQEVERTHRAAVVAAGATKPESVYTVERVDDRVRVLAHMSEAIPRQYLMDMALLRQYLDGALREGYRLALEYQIINGTGQGENLTGLLQTPFTWTQQFDTDPLVTCRKAITTLEVVNISAGAFVLHPSDWETFEAAHGPECPVHAIGGPA